ncbi:hypothetical protein PTKIN_Ptkin17bG0028400 [Pterospermum kingtungense]
MVFSTTSVFGSKECCFFSIFDCFLSILSSKIFPIVIAPALAALYCIAPPTNSLKMNSFNGYGPYGFRPSEEELIGYLRNRTLHGRDYLVQEITDLGADICNWEPWDLSGCCKVTSSDQEWYFIYPITYKHPNAKPKNTATNEGGGGGKGSRKRGRKPINRATKDGKWKVQGNFVEVRAGKYSKEKIAIKTRLYFYTNGDNNENNKKGKSSYQNKTPWVLYEYELIDIDPNQNKYFLGKLMKNQYEPTNMSSNKGETSQQLPSNCIENDHFPAQEIQHEESLVEMELSNGYDWIQIQSSEQTNEFVNPFTVVNYETYPEERSNFVNDENYEVISNPRSSNLENSVADYAVPQNLQVDYTELITNPEVPNVGIGDQNQLCTNQNDQYFFQDVFIDNDENYPDGTRNQHNIVADDEVFNWHCGFSNYPTTDMSQMNLFDHDGLYVHELFGVPDAPDNNSDGVQNQSSMNQQVSDGLPQNLQVDYTELITNPEVPNVGIGDQNQLCTNQNDQYFFQDVFIGNDENYPEGTRNQHNIVAEDEVFNWPCDFSNYPIIDVSQMNLFDLDGLYVHELFGVPDAPDNNGDGVQNQSSINQQVSDGLCFHELFGVPEALDNNNGDGVQNQSSINQQVAETNSNAIKNEIPNPVERRNQHDIIAAADTEGSNLPSFGMTVSSRSMESSGKRSAMELGGSSIDIETEVVQTQAKKSRF